MGSQWIQGSLPFVIGSDTSKAAAISMLETAKTDAAKIWRLIAWSGSHGMTDDEIEVSLGMRHQTASARRRGLVIKGLVADSGLRRRTRSGRKAAVWITYTTKPRQNSLDFD